ACPDPRRGGRHAPLPDRGRHRNRCRRGQAARPGRARRGDSGAFDAARVGRHLDRGNAAGGPGRRPGTQATPCVRADPGGGDGPDRVAAAVRVARAARPRPGPGQVAGGSVIEAVFFDVDDTLVGYASPSRKALDEGVGAGDAYALGEEISGPYFERHARGEVEFEPMRIERTAAFLRALGRAADAGRAAAFEQARFTALNRSFVLFDDVLACLDVLRKQSLLLGVITN